MVETFWTTFWTTYWTTLILSALVMGGISGGLCSWLATTKGRDSAGWFWIGFFCGPIGILALGLSPTVENRLNEEANADESLSALPKSKECPRCHEQIKFKAVVCHYCGNEFGEEAVLESVALHQKEAEARKQKLEAEKLLIERLQREEIEQERLAADLKDREMLLYYIRNTNKPSTLDGMKYIEIFIRAGAAINHKSHFLRVTPLHCAVGLQNEGLVKLLLKNGANVDATDIFGKTPLDHAISRKNPNAADLIYKAGGRSGKDLRRSRSEARKLARTISFICKNCKKELTVSAKLGGRSGTCNTCGTTQRVPIPTRKPSIKVVLGAVGITAIAIASIGVFTFVPGDLSNLESSAKEAYTNSSASAAHQLAAWTPPEFSNAAFTFEDIRQIDISAKKRCLEIRSDARLTVVQMDAAEAEIESTLARVMNTFKGRRVVWEGWISKATTERDEFTSRLRIDMDPPSGTFGSNDYDVELFFQSNSSPLIYAGRKASFEGTISELDWGPLPFRVTLNDVK